MAVIPGEEVTPPGPGPGVPPTQPDPTIKACRDKCDKQHRRDIMDANGDPVLLQKAEDDWNACLAACGAETPEPYPRKPCKTICEEQYTLDKNKAKYDQCLAKCGTTPEPADCKKDCANAYAIDKDPIKYEKCLAACNQQTPGGCGQGPGADYPGCTPCGKKYMLKAGENSCQAGYVAVPKGSAGIQCECIAWCKGIGYEADCVTKKGGGTTPGGEWDWSEEMKAMLKRLYERYNFLLDNPRGTTDAEREAIYGQAMEGIKRGERGRLQSSGDTLARMGLAGSGIELDEGNKIKRETNELLSGTRRQIATEEVKTRFDQLMQTTGLAQSLLQAGMSSEQLKEVLNAARRGESNQALQLMMTYLQMLYGNQANQWLPYWQAIINQGNT